MARTTDHRGSSRDRRERKLYMLGTFGNGTSCSCAHCGTELTFQTVTADRIVPGSQGGSYRRENVQPSCQPCNRARSDNVAWTPQLAIC